MRNELLLGRIYDAALHPEGWSTVALDLEEALGGAVMLALPQPRAGRRGRVVAPSLKPRFVESYALRFFGIDPQQLDCASQPPETLQRCVDEEGLLATPFYKDWMEPQGLHHPCRGVIERDNHFGVATIDLYRRRDEAPLSDTAFRLLESLLPHMRRAVRLYARQLRADAERHVLATVSDQFPVGVILVDGCGRLQSANRQGERILERDDGLSVRSGGMLTTAADETPVLRDAIGRAAGAVPDAGDGQVSALVVPRSSGRRSLHLLVAPADAPASRDESGLAVLYVCDPEDAVEPSHEMLRALYNLTPAEAALVGHLTVGRTLEEAAGSLGITRGTARQRLGQIFSKTGVCRQAALVRMVLTGPAAMQAPCLEEARAAS